MSDFTVSFNLFCEFVNFEVWDAAEEKERRGENEKKKEEATQGGTGPDKERSDRGWPAV